MPVFVIMFDPHSENCLLATRGANRILANPWARPKQLDDGLAFKESMSRHSEKIQ
jgi:hypothetical protein